VQKEVRNQERAENQRGDLPKQRLQFIETQYYYQIERQMRSNEYLSADSIIGHTKMPPRTDRMQEEHRDQLSGWLPDV
jgi:hypothetical protein